MKRREIVNVDNWMSACNGIDICPHDGICRSLPINSHNQFVFSNAIFGLHCSKLQLVRCQRTRTTTMTMMLSRTTIGNGRRENGATSTLKIMYPMTKITVNELKWFMLLIVDPIIYYIIACSSNSRNQVRNNLYLPSFFVFLFASHSVLLGRFWLWFYAIALVVARNWEKWKSFSQFIIFARARSH